jgi:hypothetical protein
MRLAVRARAVAACPRRVLGTGARGSWEPRHEAPTSVCNDTSFVSTLQRFALPSRRSARARARATRRAGLSVSTMQRFCGADLLGGGCSTAPGARHAKQVLVAAVHTAPLRSRRRVSCAAAAPLRRTALGSAAHQSFAAAPLRRLRCAASADGAGLVVSELAALAGCTVYAASTGAPSPAASLVAPSGTVLCVPALWVSQLACVC